MLPRAFRVCFETTRTSSGCCDGIESSDVNRLDNARVVAARARQKFNSRWIPAVGGIVFGKGLWRVRERERRARERKETKNWIEEERRGRRFRENERRMCARREESRRARARCARATIEFSHTAQRILAHSRIYSSEFDLRIKYSPYPRFR